MNTYYTLEKSKDGKKWVRIKNSNFETEKFSVATCENLRRQLPMFQFRVVKVTEVVINA